MILLEKQEGNMGPWYKDSSIILIILLTFFLFSLAFGLSYLDGTTKAEFLREHRQIELPWYRAMMLPDMVFMEATITNK